MVQGLRKVIHYSSKEQKRAERIASALFSMGFILFLLVVVSFIWITIQRNIEFWTDFELFDEIDSMEMKVKANTSRLEAHMVHVSNAQMISNYLLSGNEEERKNIEDFFIKVIEYNVKPNLPTFDQIRILDINGMEKVRVDLSNENKAVVVPENQLQDKSDRYYFKESLVMDNNTVYISPLDLNVENGRIEFPLNPVIRVSKAIYDDFDSKIGFLIMNQKYNSVFNEIDKLNEHEGDQLYLLNNEGYYLHHPDKLKTYGFMIDDEVNHSFFNDFPEIWSEVLKGDTRKFKSDEGIVYVREFDPNTESVFKNTTIMNWYLIMIVPYVNYNSQNILLNRAILMGLLFVSPFLILIGSVLGRSIIRNRWYMKRLERSATHDDMTGLLNHQAVMDQLDYLINLASRQQITICSAFLDLNDLKRINDTMGHDKGDLLIVAMSQSIKIAVRNTDIAARIGGDEFIIFFPDMSPDNSRLVLERIKEEFATRGQIIFGWETQFSWGISQWEHGNDSAENFIARADKAMYLMKEKMKKEGY